MKVVKKVLIAALLVSVFATGCGKNTGKTESAAVSKDTPVTASIWMIMHPSEKTEWFADDATGLVVLREKTGVSLKWQLVPGGNAQLANESYNLLMASGDIPDIVIGDVNLRLKLYPQAWVAIDEIIKKDPARYPNLNKYILQDEYMSAYLTGDDGHIRYIPMISTRRIGSMLFVREDLLAKYGLEPPVTADDWHTALTRAKNDGKIPFMTRGKRPELLNGLFTGYMDNVMEDYFVEDGKVKYGVLDPRFKETIELARQWYAEGLIDPEYPTTDSTRWWERVLRGDVFATHDNVQRIPAANQEFIQNQNSAMRIMGVGPMESPRTHEQRTISHYPHVRDRSAAISVNAKNPERILDFYEYCFSDEGFILMNWGIEGQSFNYVDGKPTLDPNFSIDVENGKIKHVVTIRDMPKLQKDELVYDYNLEREDHQSLRDARDLFVANDYIRENWIASLSFTDAERAILAPIVSELDTYRSEWLDKFIMGIEPMSKWDAFTSQLQKMELQKTIDVYQQALDRLLK